MYDEKIAPELLRLGKLCQENGLSFVCGVEWEPGELGRTATLTKDAGEGMRVADKALQVGHVVGIALTIKNIGGV